MVDKFRYTDQTVFELKPDEIRQVLGSNLPDEFELTPLSINNLQLHIRDGLPAEFIAYEPSGETVINRFFEIVGLEIDSDVIVMHI
jgi:hypothetical protein